MSRWHSIPAEVYRLVEQSEGSVLLESAAPDGAFEDRNTSRRNPQSHLFTSPIRVLVARTFKEVAGLFAEIERAIDAGLRAAGYFSYECAGFFEPAAQTLQSSPTDPLAWFGVFERPYLFDHAGGEFVDGEPPGMADLSAPETEPATSLQLDTRFSLTEPQYALRIAEIHELIRAGELYQLNFTTPIQVRTDSSPSALYAHLRSRQPAPYGAFLHTQAGSRVLSFSPELFFRIDSATQSATPMRRITTQPMKGTAPRGRTTIEDRAQADWLATDPKNRAENVMIVDLLRNDLGRLCSFGSVQVTDLFGVERYPTLWQMTSTVSGELRPGVGYEQIFRALFPCGSVTGAPKIRAMQCIAKLEQQPRGVYTGAIGFFSKEEAVFSVAIRTLTLHGEGAQQVGAMSVGSGIVIDSEASAEWSECRLKARFLTGSSGAEVLGSPSGFSLIETLLWRDGYPLLELHLDRLEDSAHYFAFPFNRAAAKAALESHAAALVPDQPQLPRAPSFPQLFAECAGNHESQPVEPRKVRLLWNAAGSNTVSSEPIAPTADRPVRVRIASRRTDSRDPFYFHKTTHRPLYASSIKDASAAGYDDELFLNERGQVTEGAIHNLFIERAGRLLTPPIECGVLPGVQRRQILTANAAAEERVLTLDDLRNADAVYLSNAVRGLRRAVIDWQA